jgi:GTP-binding protein
MTSTAIVALVGRPNVGKSALFNRLLGRRSAIVEPTPGVTRDRIYAPVEWRARRFIVVDTGGIDVQSGDDVSAQTREQARLAVAEAQVVVFIVDARDGVMPGDSDVAKLLRAHKKKVLLVANKVESPKTAGSIYEFCPLGFGEPLPVSAIHGLQSGDLLDAIVAKLPPQEAAAAPDDPSVVRLAIVGQPNVGKSSLVNALLGQPRAVVSPAPGTTRDATDTAVSAQERSYVIIDTAGIRRHVRRSGALEYYSSLRAVAAIGRCDVALLLIDAQTGASVQDKRIAGLATQEGKALAIMVNKWDLRQSAGAPPREEAKAALSAQFAFAPYAPVIFGSALTRKGIHKIWNLAAALADERRKRVATAQLNDVVRTAFTLHPPALQRGHVLKCYYATQAEVAPPTFVFFVNDPRLVHFSYERYLENAIREAFGFAGTPIRLLFRPRVQQDRTSAEELIASAPRERAR